MLYNEGYKSSTDNAIIRKDLCGEAMRLCVLLAQSETGNLPKTHALLSMICFQSARFDARVDAEGKSFCSKIKIEAYGIAPDKLRSCAFERIEQRQGHQ
ncbi:MAG: hypothetical protein IPO94_17505 [Saprospiraceae bacterium]|nr:hypothetical protein [Saprospiraceae bacterium]